MSINPRRILLVLSLTVLCSGCSVLTRTQVKEVNRFATAAQDYGEMPGAVIAEHARIRKIRQVLSASTDFNGDTALEAIQIALAQQKELEERSRQADTALNVLKDYAELLVKLSSDQFSDNLQESAESLGKSIDKGIRQYNKTAGENLGMLGSSVAAAVRGIGGAHIRNEQEKALKTAITSADPVVRSMTWTVEETMALYLDPEQLNQIKNLSHVIGKPELVAGGILSQEKKGVMDKYRTTAARFEGKQPTTLALTVADEIEDCDNAAALAAEALKGAQSYREAHTKLAQNVLRKRDLSVVIEEVEALVDEVNSAQALKRKLDKK